MPTPYKSAAGTCIKCGGQLVRLVVSFDPFPEDSSSSSTQVDVGCGGCGEYHNESYYHGFDPYNPDAVHEPCRRSKSDFKMDQK